MNIITRVPSMIGLLLCATAQQAGATVLTFEFGGIPPHYLGISVPQDYGDRVTAESVPGSPYTYYYGVGAGFTPHVVTEYFTEPGFELAVWTFAGAGDLYPYLSSWGSLTVGSGIVLIPDPGYRVTLHSFDLACIGGICVSGDDFTSGADFTTFQVLAGNEVAIDFIAAAGGSLTIDSFNHGHDTFVPEISSTLPITIFWRDNSGLAFQNIHFTESPVPLPGAAWLLISAIAAARALRRRR